MLDTVALAGLIVGAVQAIKNARANFKGVWVLVLVLALAILFVVAGHFGFLAPVQEVLTLFGLASGTTALAKKLAPAASVSVGVTAGPDTDLDLKGPVQ